MPIWLRSSLTSIVAGAEKAGPEAGEVYKAACGRESFKNGKASRQ